MAVRKVLRWAEHLAVWTEQLSVAHWAVLLAVYLADHSAGNLASLKAEKMADTMAASLVVRKVVRKAFQSVEWMDQKWVDLTAAYLADDLAD